jgi:RNA-binding protein
MARIELTAEQRRLHRAQAHHLDPVVAIGGDGLTEAVRKEIESALDAHGLIKIRVHSDDRALRQSLLEQIASETGAAAVQHIGKLLVLWRPPAERAVAPDENRKPAPRQVKVLRYSDRGGQRPQVQTLRVLGNQRLTQGGTVKRAKPRQSSSKKRALD